MKRYAIKTTYTATESNLNFKGETQIWHTGKQSMPLCNKDEEPRWGWLLGEYGFKTIAAATKGLNARKELAESEERYGAWKVQVEVVEFNF